MIEKKRIKTLVSAAAIALCLCASAESWFFPQYKGPKGQQPRGEVTAQLARENEFITKNGFIVPALMGWLKPAQAGLVNSVQTGTATAASGSATGDSSALGTAVSTSLASIHLIGWRSDATNTSGIHDIGYITQQSSTVIRVTRNGTTGNLTAVFVVIDWKSSAVRTVQMGTITLTTTATSNTAVLGTSITTTNAAIQWNGSSSSILGSGANAMVRFNLTSTAGGTVTMRRNTGTSATVIGAYCVIEWQSGILNSNTQEATASASGTTATGTFGSAVTLNQTWLMNGGCSSNWSASWNGQYYVRAYMATTTTFTAESNASGGQIDCVGTAVEFKASDLQGNVQRGHATELKDATNAYVDITITALTNTNNAVPYMFGANQSSGSGNDAKYDWLGVLVQSTTALRAQRGAVSSTIGMTPAWEVFEFKN